jgi:acyl-homoserine-lactone acylase
MLKSWVRPVLGLALALFAQAAFAASRDEILWDRWGVAHVYAGSTAGLFKGYGWAQTRSHGDLLLRLYAEARGRAGEYYGEAELANDRWMAINNVPTRSRAWLAAQTPEFRRYLEAFAEGINAYARAHPEKLSAEARRVLPVTAVDVVGHAHRVFQYIYLAPQTVVDRLPSESKEPAEPPGSNGWAIAPSRSQSGKTMILMNPHLPWPRDWSTYYEIELRAPGLALYGASQIGLPVLRFMFSDYLGFTQTVNNVNGVTYYKVVPASGGYRFDGKVLPYKVRSTVLKVRQADGTMKAVPLAVRETVHGPVIAERGGAPIAMKVAGLDRPRALEQYWRMGTAHNFKGYEAALRQLQIPTFNVIYGDRDGRIQYLYNGLVPKVQGRDYAYWTGVVPGDRSDTLWTGYYSYEELPKTTDPRGGTVQNSNDPPWSAAFPVVQDSGPWRNIVLASRINLRMAMGIRMLASKPKIGFEDLKAFKFETRSELADRVLPELLQAADQYGTPLARQAADVLRRWDRKTLADSRGALLFLDWSDRKGAVGGYEAAGWATPYVLPDPLNTPRGLADPKAAAAALDAAARSVIAAYGSLDRPWGEAMRLRIDGVDLPASGGPGRLGIFDVIDYGPPAGDGTRTANFGDSFVALVSFDGPARAKVLMTYGNASQPGDPHGSDQLPLTMRRELRDAWRTRAEVEANLESRETY